MARSVFALFRMTTCLVLGSCPCCKQLKVIYLRRAGGLICEPLKAVWPAYAGIVTQISLVDRASYLLSLVPLCTLESGLHPAPPLTRNSPSPKSSAPQSSSPDP